MNNPHLVDLVGIITQALDRAYQRGMSRGFKEGEEHARETVADWYEPEPPERED